MRRSELYECVWRTPLLQLAEEFGISTAGLKKVCERYQIPTPSRGYWQKLAAGIAVQRTPLLPGDDCEIAPFGHDKRRLAGLRLADVEGAELAEVASPYPGGRIAPNAAGVEASEDGAHVADALAIDRTEAESESAGEATAASSAPVRAWAAEQHPAVVSIPDGADPPPAAVQTSQHRLSERDFYEPCAAWLLQQREELLSAIPVGGAGFGDRWSTPDILGYAGSRPHEFIQRPQEIWAVELKTDCRCVLEGYAQASMYRVWAHQVVLVIPESTPPVDLNRLLIASELDGIGLVVFDSASAICPDFRFLRGARRQQPDLQFTNRYMKTIGDQLVAR